MEPRQIWQMILQALIIGLVMWGVLMAQQVQSRRYILSAGQDTVDRAELQRHLDDISKRLQEGGN